jgi:hypothetical protein
MANNCAWCGDPPDENGSHGICDEHAAQLVAQSAARKAAKEENEETSSASHPEPASKA